MRNTFAFLFLFCVLAASVMAQKEGNIWYFGINAGLDFNNGSPSALVDGAMISVEGVASVCNESGDLLFYTNGQNVWNKHHQLMWGGTGLYGDPSSTQAAVIVPRPSDKSTYYIFTTDWQLGTLGMNYSIVNMATGDSLGEVRWKNFPLIGNSTEKLTVIRHANQRDFWVIGHEFNSNSFYAYKVTKSGVSGQPVISSIGWVHKDPHGNRSGHMKASADGKKIAVAIADDWVVEVFDFDNQTGQITNPVTMQSPLLIKAYGLEFSQSGHRLYVTRCEPTSKLFQFDATRKTGAAMLASAVEIASDTLWWLYGAIQMGPDGTMYIARHNSPNLATISNPEGTGLSCGFNTKGVSLINKKSQLGLPQLIFPNYDSVKIECTQLCFGDTTLFQLKNAIGYDSVRWDFGDNTKDSLGVTRWWKPKHHFVALGKYTITATLYSSDDVEVYTRELEIAEPPTIELGAPVEMCKGGSVGIGTEATVGAPPYTYTWMPSLRLNRVDSSRVVASPDSNQSYIVIATDAHGCIAIDTILVIVHRNPQVDAGDRRILCKGSDVPLSASVIGGVGPYRYYWSPSVFVDNPALQSPLASPDSTTMFYITVKDAYDCIGRDSVLVVVNEAPKIELGDDHSICLGDSIALHAQVRGGTEPYFFEWTPTSGLSTTFVQAPVARPSMTTIYRVEVRDAYGCIAVDSLTISVVALQQPWIELNGSLTLCSRDSVTLTAFPPLKQYKWSNGNVSRSIIVKDTGTYRCVVTDSSGCFLETPDITVTRASELSPKLVLDGPPGFCPGESRKIRVVGKYQSYRWSDGSTDSVLVVTSAGSYSVTVSDSTGCLVSSAMQTITAFDVPAPVIKGPETVCLDSEEWYQSSSSGKRRYSWTVFGGAIVQGNGTRAIRVKWSTSGIGKVVLTETVDSSGCVGSKEIDVRVGPTLNPHIDAFPSNIICDGDSVVLSLRFPYPWRQWSTGDSSESISVRTSGTFIVHVRSSEGCDGFSDTLFVIVKPRFSLSISGNRNVCLTTSESYSIADTNDKIIMWFAENGTVLGNTNSNSIIIRWDSAGSGRVRCIVRDTVIGCSQESEINVRILPTQSPKITADGLTAFCLGDSTRLYVDSGYAQYMWSNGETGRQIFVKVSGVYFATVRSNEGCSFKTDSVVVIVRPAPIPNIAGKTSVCANASETYFVNPPSGGLFQWTAVGGTIATTSTASFVNVKWNAAGFAQIIVHVTQGECHASDTLRVNIIPLIVPTVTSSEPFEICEGNEILLDAGGPFSSYRWNTGDTTRSLRVSNAGSYTVTVVTVEGCLGVSAPVSIRSHPLPQPQIIGPAVFCFGDTVQLKTDPGYVSYVWAFPDGSSHNEMNISTFQSGDYLLTVVDTNGCIGVSDEFRLDQYPIPQKPVITRIGTQLTTSSAQIYHWYLDGIVLTGETQQMLTFTRYGMYRVETTDSNGCRAMSDPFEVREDIQAASTISLPVLTASPGERVSIPVSLSEAKQLAAAGIDGFFAMLRFNKYVLFPTGQTPIGTIQGNDRLIPITIDTKSFPSTLTFMDFIAMLGPVDTSSLSFDSFLWRGGSANVNLNNGFITITTCKEGGIRLFDSDGVVRLHQNQPNPFNAMTTIDYEVIEIGFTELAVYDMLGRKVHVLASGYLQPGKYRVSFDAHSMPSGVYTAVLQTPTRILTRRMLLLR